jgi:hypothetical protein
LGERTRQECAQNHVHALEAVVIRDALCRLYNAAHPAGASNGLNKQHVVLLRRWVWYNVIIRALGRWRESVLYHMFYGCVRLACRLQLSQNACQVTCWRLALVQAPSKVCLEDA